MQQFLIFLLFPQIWWPPTWPFGPGLIFRSVLSPVRRLSGPLPEPRLSTAVLCFCVGALIVTTPCNLIRLLVDSSTTAGHVWCQVDTHFQEEMGWLKGGEVTAFVKRQEKAGGRRAGVQPDAGRGTCETDTSAVGGRWNQALLPWLQAVVDWHYHCRTNVMEGLERQCAVPSREKTGRTDKKGKIKIL